MTSADGAEALWTFSQAFTSSFQASCSGKVLRLHIDLTDTTIVRRTCHPSQSCRCRFYTLHRWRNTSSQQAFDRGHRKASKLWSKTKWTGAFLCLVVMSELTKPESNSKHWRSHLRNCAHRPQGKRNSLSNGRSRYQRRHQQKPQRHLLRRIHQRYLHQQYLVPPERYPITPIATSLDRAFLVPVHPQIT
jgi:hypothetical protein